MGNEMSEQEFESLKLAIKTEEDGRAMYLAAAEKVTNPLAQATMKQLAKEETIHIEVIKKFYDSLNAGLDSGVDKIMEQAMNYDLRKKTIFETARGRMDAAVEADPDAIDAYHAALKFEEDGANMYKELSGKTTDPVAKKLYDFMFEQESEHYRILDESLNYLENPNQWFIGEEKPHFEG